MVDATFNGLPTQRVVLSSETLIQQVGDETVLLDMASEQYFGLDATGSRIWNLLGELGDVQLVFERLCVEYEGDPERIRNDLLTLLQNLTQAGLVRLG